MKAKISFGIPQFNSLGNKNIKFKEQETAEETFKSILKSLNKNLSKNWQSIEFDFKGQNIQVLKHWLIETGFNFEQSHVIS